MNINRLKEREELKFTAHEGVKEFTDIVQAMIEVPDSGLGSEHQPGFNNGYASLIETLLEKKYGVKSDITLGYSGIGLVPNTYIDNQTGRKISHAEVLNRIKNAFGGF